ncbi:MAG: glycerol-3-phosphate dehydrogenase [Alphaproteobacteria bacterium]|jgi:glycerol-3-phosphate dehydrogenase subunit C|nr:glycerol-3-phosphate dehydrogenase [Alphaproteobacteria bacterium]
MREGSLDAPTRHPIDWHNPEFYDEAALDAELRRVFDICHGCRRCFNLCDSFPRLFDLVDASPTEELDGVASADFKPVVDACTLCDMCFLTKCPYVPPHEFNLDFPHLMLRYRAVELKKGDVGFWDRQLTATDRNGRLAGLVAPLANWATAQDNAITRPILEGIAGIHRDADLPKFHGKTFAARARTDGVTPNAAAPGFGRKAVLYATCFVNYNNPGIGEAARRVLAHNGVATEVVYPACCGMPQLEHGDLAKVADRAETVARDLEQWIDDGYDVVALTPSCALMLKFEWPLIVPDDAKVRKLAQATFDLSEYVVDIARKEGMAPGLQPLAGGVAVHLACHARAQNMGAKAADMLRLIPDTKIDVIERCSGHGGSWGVQQEYFEVALKVGKPAARQAAKAKPAYVASECPLAGEHLIQGMQRLGEAEKAAAPKHATNPIELIDAAYRLSK